MKKVIGNKRLFIIFCIALSFLLCYKSFDKESLNFDGILKAEVQPQEDGRNVFFIETGESIINVTLNSRQTCAIESAAVTNPQLKVFVFFSSIERFRALTVTPELEAILSYPNVFVKFLNATELSIGSPLEDFIRTDKLSTSSYKVEHTSDALRLLVLWKYGGIYVDTDMIVRKNFDKVPSNFACRQSSGEINGAIIGFNSQVDGKTLARMFLANLTQRFDGQFFPANGPVLITRVVKGLCGTNDLKKIIEMKSCQGFHSLNNSLCYEISYPEWKKLMEENFTEEVLRRVENSVAVHFWNHVSRSVTLKSDSRAAYTTLGRQFCPKVMESCGEFF